ncbi:MAG: chorismate synthase [Muribaculaceae bacterium]|nr:chorismate synthase [Muribaculaceae bacterium]
MNSFGSLIRLTTFGESHGKAMGGILDGMPPGVVIDMDIVRHHLERRRPGSGQGVSQRKETDDVEILSGISPVGETLGTPIGFIIRNKDARSEDYAGYTGKYRLNHADYTYHRKYGIHDFRGGGRASARETVSWVVAGSIVRQWLWKARIAFDAKYVATLDAMKAASEGDSVGGIVTGKITGLPAGLGEPVFDKLQSRLGAAMLSINAVKAFEYGDGNRSARMKGSECADRFRIPHDPLTPFSSNHCGGIMGGISNGMEVNFNVYFKPAPTIMRPMETIDTEGKPCVIEPKGRHDSCVAIRAVPIVESMAALVIGDMVRLHQSYVPLERYPEGYDPGPIL